MLGKMGLVGRLRTKNKDDTHDQGIRKALPAAYPPKGLYTDTALRVFGQQLEKGQVTAVTAAIGGQGPDTCRNLCSSREIGKPNLSEL